MTRRDPELTRLLVQELERYLPTLDADPVDKVAAERALQALKGSAGLAGERELYGALDRLDRRSREGDASALREAPPLIRSVARRLAGGETAFVDRWPVPPDDLVTSDIDPRLRQAYISEVRDRLARIDEALAAADDPFDAARTVYRHVHTMKGTASSVGDEVMSWFCHGLEERIKGADSLDLATAAVQETGRWRDRGSRPP